jgi:hypothetical protein
MSTNFIVYALQANAFKNLFELDNVALEKLGIKRMIVDEFPGSPCRVKNEKQNHSTQKVQHHLALCLIHCQAKKMSATTTK